MCDKSIYQLVILIIFITTEVFLINYVLDAFKILIIMYYVYIRLFKDSFHPIFKGSFHMFYGEENANELQT
ncbi:hypothetical protein crov470 [Cafeteria roenbergensis virus]|uniref:Uncharacterized protein n=1 Tax=Cafeteria roenbergensis virus (strain BV-PW1) TaxID=693272 RepID=E3T5P1_CROVB|nr:hypothetical protein crov470 [Cafeteria roenbergensis virus BV-PW1]ADO67504.1 hypothetical protein crov470 [Cafeteria roenbergensis virus BV-PW1]